MSDAANTTVQQRVRNSTLPAVVFVLSGVLAMVAFDVRQSYFSLVASVDSESKAKVKSWQMYLNIGNVLQKMNGTLTEIKHEQTETRKDIRELRDIVEEKPNRKP